MKDVLWVGPLTVFVAVGTFFSGGGHDGFTAWEWVSVLVAAAACLSLLAGRRTAELGVFLPGLLVGGYLACGFADGPVYLPLFLGAHVAARAVPVPRWLPWFAGAIALSVVGMAVRAVTTDLGWWQPTGQAIGVAALATAAATIGSLVRSRQQTDAERAARAASEEQLRMAQDLHDGVGHGLAVIAMQAGVALHVLERDPARARASLEAIRDTSRESLTALREELTRMSGSDPAPRRPAAGLAELEPLLERVRSGGLVVERRGDGGAAGPAVGEAAYAVVQEALTNVLRHARATRAVVTLERTDGGLVVAVEDDGIGSVGSVGSVDSVGPVDSVGSVGSVREDAGMGITGMRARVARLGGTLEAGSGEEGFVVRAVIPVPDR